MKNIQLSRRLRLSALVIVITLVAAACASAAPPKLDLDTTAPPIPIPNESLLPIGASDLESILVGQLGNPVVVNIWASWCAPCRAEAPLLQRAHVEFGDQVTFIGIASNDRAKDAAKFLDRFGITYPNLLDRSGEVTTLLEMSNFPTTYVFGRDGVLRAKVTGGISERQLAAVVGDALRS